MSPIQSGQKYLMTGSINNPRQAAAYQDKILVPFPRPNDLAVPLFPGPRRGDNGSFALHVRRLKNGTPSVHPLRGDELRALRELQRSAKTPFVFETERETGFTADAVNQLVKGIGKRAKLPLLVHVHMLRHSCGYALANAGHDTRRIQSWLGHRSIQHTVRYTELSARPFKEFWRS